MGWLVGSHHTPLICVQYKCTAVGNGPVHNRRRSENQFHHRDPRTNISLAQDSDQDITNKVTLFKTKLFPETKVQIIQNFWYQNIMYIIHEAFEKVYFSYYFWMLKLNMIFFSDKIHLRRNDSNIDGQNNVDTLQYKQ